MKRLIAASLVGAALSGLFVASAHAESTAPFLDRQFLSPHDSRITGEMVVQNWQWYGIDVLPQLVILAAETSLGDPDRGGKLVRYNNFGCMRYNGTASKWGSLSSGRTWVAGKDWYTFPSPQVGMMAFGRYLKVGVDGFYRKVLDGPPYDWAAFAARYYGRSVPGYSSYVSRLQAFERSFRNRAAAAGFVW